MPSEILKQLLENDVLTEDTKQSIKSAFETVLQEAREAARVEVEQELTAKLAEDFVKDRDALVESVDALVTKALAEHIESHKADLESFRDLEAESAAKLVEANQTMVEQSKKDLKALVEKLDAFLDVVVKEEFEEIKEDLVESQRHALGLKIFEGFKKEFEQLYVNQTGISGQLEKLQSQLTTTQAENAQLKESLQAVTREHTTAKVLSPLEGKARQVMETILSTVSTDKLQETYDRFISRVLTESEVAAATAISTLTEGKNSEKEQEVLAEQRIDPNTVSLKTGDEPETKKGVLTESASGLSEEDKRRLLKTAGLL